jgi:hypothetical protein
MVIWFLAKTFDTARYHQYIPVIWIFSEGIILLVETQLYTRCEPDSEDKIDFEQCSIPSEKEQVSFFMHFTWRYILTLIVDQFDQKILLKLHVWIFICFSVGCLSAMQVNDSQSMGKIEFMTLNLIYILCLSVISVVFVRLN